jgi:hypothetical protein
MSESPRQLFAVPGPVFKAKYRGKCGLCDKRFSAGERIRYIGKKTVAHEACAVSSGPVNPINDLVRGDESQGQDAFSQAASHLPATAS